ncbi:MAG: class D beta-lactamase [Acidobacteriota bacterium]
MILSIEKIFISILMLLVCLQVGLAKGKWEERPDWEKYFSHANVNGSFLFYDLQTDKYLGYNLKRAKTGFIPASTFKIPNSLIALELGIVKDAEEILSWDGVERGIGENRIAEWNRDQSMREAIRYSTVWFYQELARRAGYQRMQRFINRINYGNKDIAGGIDHFWLDGRLRISSEEQIRFLVKLYQNKLPFSRRNIDIVKDILINEQTNTYVLRAKTGWGIRVSPQIGWWVGYIEREGKVYFFAINIDIVKVADTEARKAVAKEILRELKVIE